MKPDADSSHRTVTAQTRHRAVFFDFVTHYGGAQLATVMACEALQRYFDVNVIDPYGVCQRYVDALAERQIPSFILQRKDSDVVIGHRNAHLRRVISMARQIPAFIKLRQELRSTIHQLNPDVIWTNSSKGLIFLALAGIPRKTPMGFYARGWYRQEQIPAFRRWIIKRGADFVLAVSNETARQLVSLGIDHTHAHVVYTTVNTDAVLSSAHQGLEASLPGQERPVRLLCPGLLTPTKGHHTAIECAAYLHQRGVDFTLWIVGDIAIGGNDSYLQQLKQSAVEAGISDRVHFLGWRTDLAAIMSAATALVFPTHTEGLPRVVIESMLLNCPAVVTPVGGIPDLIRDGQTGFIAEVENAQGFADAVERLHADNDLRSQIIEQAATHVRQLINLDHQIGLITAAFQREIARRVSN